MTDTKRMEVFTVRTDPRTKAVTWVRAGSAVVNRDGSINVYLDALPLDGKLHMRDVVPPPPKEQ